MKYQSMVPADISAWIREISQVLGFKPGTNELSAYLTHQSRHWPPGCPCNLSVPTCYRWGPPGLNFSSTALPYI